MTFKELQGVDSLQARTWHDNNTQPNAPYWQVLTTQLNHLATLAKWLSVQSFPNAHLFAFWRTWSLKDTFLQVPSMRFLLSWVSIVTPYNFTSLVDQLCISCFINHIISYIINSENHKFKFTWIGLYGIYFKSIQHNFKVIPTIWKHMI